MTIQKFYELAQYAKKCGIKTIGELAEFKKAIGVQTNDELLYSLYRLAQS